MSDSPRDPKEILKTIDSNMSEFMELVREHKEGRVIDDSPPRPAPPQPRDKSADVPAGPPPGGARPPTPTPPPARKRSFLAEFLGLKDD